MNRFVFSYLVFAVFSNLLEAKGKIQVRNFSEFDIWRCEEAFEKITDNIFAPVEGSVLDLS